MLIRNIATKLENVSIRKQVAGIMVLVFFLMFGILYTILFNSMGKMILERERSEAKNQVTVAKNSLRDTYDYLPNITKQWAIWDQTYRFVLGIFDEFLEYNLNDYPYEIYSLDFITILDLKGDVIYERFYKTDTIDLTSIYSKLGVYTVNKFESNKNVNFNDLEQYSTSGFVENNGNYFYMSSCPILNSDKKGSAVGSLIFGRILTDKEINNLIKNDEMDISLLSKNELKLETEEFQLLDDEEKIINEINHDDLYAYSSIKDIFGNNDLVISISAPRYLYKEGVKYFEMVIGVVALSCAFIVFAILFMLNKIIIKPIGSLSKDVNDINFDSKELLVKSKYKYKESKILTESINNMLFTIKTDRDIIKKKNEDLYYSANYDLLTGLFSRSGCMDFLMEKIEEAKKNLTIVGVILLDLDRFKNINDTTDHLVGNRFLVEIANRLKEELGPEVIIGRISGDDFFIVVSGLREEFEFHLYADNVMSLFKKNFIVEDREILITVSMGTSIFPNDSQEFEGLFRNSEIAMYHAKKLGGNMYCRYENELNKVLQRKIYVENKIRASINNGCTDFMAYFQPKSMASSGDIHSCEALIRWQTPEGIISPVEFIPLAEETGLIVPLSRWMLKEACRCNKIFERNGIEHIVSVNIPSQVLLHKDFFVMIEEAANESGIDIKKLDIEITEETLLEDVGKVKDVLEKLHDWGITSSIDDFGTGYSSLSYLKKLPVDRIKIDRSFIIDLNKNEDGDRSIVNAIVAMGKTLNKILTAEGVEDANQYSYLKSVGCDEIQGYYVSKPIPCEEYIQFYNRWLLDKKYYMKEVDSLLHLF